MESVGEQAWASLQRVRVKLSPILEDELARLGLSLSSYDVLLQLSTAVDGLSMGDLGDRAIVTRAHVSRVVDQLESAGLLTRSTGGRVRTATLTPAGRRKQAEASKVYRVALERELSAVSSSELSQLNGVLERLLRSKSA